jgi:hypothetical protein
MASPSSNSLRAGPNREPTTNLKQRSTTRSQPSMTGERRNYFAAAGQDRDLIGIGSKPSTCIYRAPVLGRLG